MLDMVYMDWRWSMMDAELRNMKMAVLESIEDECAGT